MRTMSTSTGRRPAPRRSCGQGANGRGGNAGTVYRAQGRPPRTRPARPRPPLSGRRRRRRPTTHRLDAARLDGPEERGRHVSDGPHPARPKVNHARAASTTTGPVVPLLPGRPAAVDPLHPARLPRQRAGHRDLVAVVGAPHPLDLLRQPARPAPVLLGRPRPDPARGFLGQRDRDRLHGTKTASQPTPRPIFGSTSAEAASLLSAPDRVPAAPATSDTSATARLTASTADVRIQ